ncbi:SH3 domain-containing protein [Clostridium perfringens]|uniref:SH3 domain-containing protein n=1 Tax=Clostridium perfringens TaxID=1502 RepID=UPI0013E2C78D|nr:SH3 domain-containing protein [Clostridium perfringens]NGT82858.1 SH3 domain-containing protein [Clostridium perfringens]NGT82867.1 SH3 domain-containing protein [Clostridium perfringens]NGT82876.1 SH3 domain-containing protein [Clostridium perfringens]NGT82885.1 SH3 domain-containing protein [Clostridium perfringens]
MIMRFIPNVNPGDLVGSKPTFPVNAQVKGDFLYLRDANGNQISGRTVSDGDEITVLDISYSKQLILVQYPTGSGYRQGYVSNATSIIKYKDNYSWVNGSTPEAVYDLDKTTQIGTLDPRERAVILYKIDGMTAVAYDTSKGKLTKSGLVHYEGTGGSAGGGDINGVSPGEIVSGGFTYPNNAQVVGDDLYLRDANGNQISGRLVSNGDNITVLDVGYTKQLALVQYPSGNDVRQGYVTNATKLIRYFKQGEWLNGSTTEPVLDENGGSLGSLSPYEAATPLYEKNGMIHVVYDTVKGSNTKSGYVKFKGLSELPDTGIQIPSASHSQATVEVYGTSGKGRPLKVYKIGSGSKVLFAGFALHGWEDHWENDGLALVKIANSLISRIGDYKSQNGLHGWTVYIAPCMNPDGVIVRGTENGPGRCAVKSRIDMNRCFPRGFKSDYRSRYYTGPEPLGAQEAVALKNFIERINRTADEMVVIDSHGWLGCTYGDSSIAQYFTRQFGFSHNGPSGGGYFSYWAQGLPKTRAILLEYPRNTYSESDIISGNYIGKTFNGIINILKNNPNGSDNDNNSGNNDANSSEIFYDASGEIINVSSTLNVRSGPGTSYNAIGTLRGGDRVTIIAKVRPLTEQFYWYRIKFGSGTGYIRSDFVKIIESGVNEIPMNNVGRIKVSSTLNVRSGPGTIYDVIGTLSNGNLVKVLAKVRPLTEQLYWYKIEFENRIGYVRSDFVVFDHSPIPPTNNSEEKAKDKAKTFIKNVFGDVGLSGDLKIDVPVEFKFLDFFVKFTVGIDGAINKDAPIVFKITDKNIDDSTIPGMIVKNGFNFVGLFSDVVNEFITKFKKEFDAATVEIGFNITDFSLVLKVSTPLYSNKEEAEENGDVSKEANVYYEIKLRVGLKEFAEELIEEIKELIRLIQKKITNPVVAGVLITLIIFVMGVTPIDELLLWIPMCINFLITQASNIINKLLEFIFSGNLQPASSIKYNLLNITEVKE